MKYNFDEMIDRQGTHSAKLDRMPEGSPEDALSVWVADMDLPCAEPILEALHKRIDQKIFGYTIYENDECKNAVTNWFLKRFDWKVDKEDIFFSPGVVPAIAFLIHCLTNEGDGIIIQRPVYYPFTNKIEASGRRVVNNSLVKKGNTYVIDFDDLEKKFADETVKGMIFCSPHNPVGRVWTEQELKQIVEIAKKYDKWIISDEIHGDLTRVGIKHIPLLKVAPEYKDRIIVCTAPSKTFNLAGMQFSNIVIPNKEYQKKWLHTIDEQFSVSLCNPFGLTAIIAAYNEGEEWLEQVREYIDGNIEYVKQYVKDNLEKAEVIECEGTYLVWVNLREYCQDAKELERLMQNVARVAFDEGYIFGEEGIGFERINVATQRKNVEECMKRMKKAIDTIK